ncbi:MAG: hypothetical protein ACE5E5_10565 [Phycisphaerae bacterium]
MILDAQRLVRSATKAAIAPFLRWEPLTDPKQGFSLILAAPWALRDILPVNLRFVAMQDLQDMDCIYVVFDRPPRREGDAFIDRVSREFSDLPLVFQFHPPVLGHIVEFVNRSKFYASLSWVTGLSSCRTTYAILHDFDLYPVQADFFQQIYRTMLDQRLRFSGSEYTHFDGLTDRDALIGTWELGIDVAWLRANHRPADCFHAVAEINARRVDLDALSLIQSTTPRRSLAGAVGRHSYAHVRNLCSTYLLWSAHRPVRVAWRLHYLWYLEFLAGCEARFCEATTAMMELDSPMLTVGGRTTNYLGVHTTCASVLRRDLTRMETALFGKCRPEVTAYLEATESFFLRYGGTRPLHRVNGAHV